MGRAREQALKEALQRSVLVTSIVVPPPTVSAAQIRARAGALPCPAAVTALVVASTVIAACWA